MKGEDRLTHRGESITIWCNKTDLYYNDYLYSFDLSALVGSKNHGLVLIVEVSFGVRTMSDILKKFCDF